MFVNAASGSAKNITPNRETTRSNRAPGAAASKSAVCASAVTTVALGTRRRAASTIADEMSTPTASAPAATAASSNVPDPHPTSSTRRAEPRSAAPSIAAVNGAKAASKIRSLRTHPSAPVAQSSRIDSFAMLGHRPSSRRRAQVGHVDALPILRTATEVQLWALRDSNPRPPPCKASEAERCAQPRLPRSPVSETRTVRG